MVRTPARLVAICLAVTLFLIAPAAYGQSGNPSHSYPSRPIRMIVPFPPGGAADFTARTLAQPMGIALGQPVIVENRVGASGAIGAEAVAKAPADGHTILLIDRGALGIAPSITKSLPYDPLQSFAYIGVATEGPYVLVVHPSVAATDLSAFVALAKAAPGKLNYGSFGIGSMAHLNFEVFKSRLGIDLVHVPYKGAADAVNAVVAGEIQIAIASPPAALGFIRAGRLRALAVGADQRAAQLPDVPTMAEAGLAGDILIPTFFAIAAPAATPAPIIARLHTEMKNALSLEDVAGKLLAIGLVPAGTPPDATAALVARDVARFNDLVKMLGITAQ